MKGAAPLGLSLPGWLRPAPDDQYLVVWDTPSGQFDALYGRRLTDGDKKW